MNEFVNIHTHRPTGRGIELHTAGVHPWKADKKAVTLLRAQLSEAQVIRETAAETRINDRQAISTTVVPLRPADIQAIGETGLDFACNTDREEQLAVFRAQLALACEYELPVILHCVHAFETIMQELALCEPRAVIFHGFIGSPEQVARAAAKGYYLSFGERTFASPKTLTAMRQTPLNRLFFETDDSMIPIDKIYDRAARVLGVSVAKLQQATLENYERIFTTK